MSEKTEVLALRKHYTTREIADAWGMHVASVNRLFSQMPGVVRTGAKKLHLRIPEDVLDRVYRERMVK
jgi:hypothetical protein